MAFKLYKIKAKSIFTRTKLPGAKWVLNQYVGCQHSCLYCYAKFMGRWLPSSYGKWGSWTEAKINAPELVQGKYVDGWVCMSSVSDPYPPVEKNLKLTRQILKNLNKDIKLSVLTKSDLVLRDIDIFKEFKNIEVGLTINDFKGDLKTIFEPFSPINSKRKDALKILKENNIKTYAFISPIIPDLIDLKSVIRETKEFVDYFWFEFINQKAAGNEFIQILKNRFPKSYKLLKDKKEFELFIEDCRSIIRAENINARGIEIHS